MTDSTVDERPEESRSIQPRVEVEFNAEELGQIDVEAYESTVRRRVQRCYSRRFYRGETEGEGTMVYEVLVTRNGGVAGADRVSSELRDDGLSSCVERALGRLRFDLDAPPRPVYRLFVRFQFVLETLVPSKPPV